MAYGKSKKKGEREKGDSFWFEGICILSTIGVYMHIRYISIQDAKIS